MHLTRAALLAALLATGCKTKNPNYCPDNPDMLCDQPDGGGVSCSADDPCATGVCKEPPGVCVECLVNADCKVAAAPVCNLSTNVCDACTEHAQCASNVCMPNGECASASAVAYVDGTNGDDNKECAPDPDPTSPANPEACKTVTRALATGKRIIKVSGIVDDDTIFDNAPTTLVLADPGTKLTKSGGGTIVDVKGTSNVTIHDLEISGATGGSSGVGVAMSGGSPTLELTGVTVSSNSGRGIVVNAGTLVLQRSIVADNLAGGVDVQTSEKVTIVNNFITTNGRSAGTAQSTLGGANIATVNNSSGSRVAFNTIVGNENSAGSVLAAGITCQVPGVDAAGNIVYSNIRGLENNDMTQRAGGCSFGNTFASGPVADHLGFDLTSNPPSYRLVNTSPATVLDVGGTCPAEDFDGEMRPMNGKCDLGADELKVP